MLTILLGAFLVVVALVTQSDFYCAHGPGLGNHGPPVEPRWLPKLLLVVVGIALILDGISEVRHH